MVSAALPCSFSTEVGGSINVPIFGIEGVSSCVETLSDCCVPLLSDWVSSERTSFTGEKQREMFALSFLLWDG